MSDGYVSFATVVHPPLSDGVVSFATLVHDDTEAPPAGGGDETFSGGEFGSGAEFPTVFAEGVFDDW